MKYPRRKRASFEYQRSGVVFHWGHCPSKVPFSLNVFFDGGVIIAEKVNL